MIMSNLTTLQVLQVIVHRVLELATEIVVEADAEVHAMADAMETVIMVA